MTDTTTGFSLNDAGKAAIVFDDPNFVRAETITLDLKSGVIHAILHEMQHQLGTLSEELLRGFANNSQVLLSSKRSDGSQIGLHAALIVYN